MLPGSPCRSKKSLPPDGLGLGARNRGTPRMRSLACPLLSAMRGRSAPRGAFCPCDDSSDCTSDAGFTASRCTADRGRDCRGRRRICGGACPIAWHGTFGHGAGAHGNECTRREIATCGAGKNRVAQEPSGRSVDCAPGRSRSNAPTAVGSIAGNQFISRQRRDDRSGHNADARVGAKNGPRRQAC
jgi:hypothetical protein